MSARTVARTGCAVTILVAIAGCGHGGSGSEGGGPLPHQLDGETYPGTRSTTTGTVVVDRGCFLVEVDGVRRLAVWPRGAGYRHDDASVVEIPGAEPVSAGSTVTGPGSVLPVTELTGYPDGYWGQQVTFCTPDATDVLVLDSVSVG